MDISCWAPQSQLREGPSHATEHRLDHRRSPLSGSRRKGYPYAESGSIELAKPSRSLAATELVYLRSDGSDAHCSRARELDEHSLVVSGGTAYVEQQNQATEQRPFGKVAFDRSGESLAIALGGARKAVAGKIHEGEPGAEIGEEVDPPRAPGSLAHPREIAPPADAIQERRFSRVRASYERDLGERPARIFRGSFRGARVVESEAERAQKLSGFTSIVRPRTSVKRK